jgi:hypothetical protein
MVGMTTDPGRVYVQDHGFVITDRGINPLFETMDYRTGVAGVMESAALIHTGIDRGHAANAAQLSPGVVGKTCTMTSGNRSVCIAPGQPSRRTAPAVQSHEAAAGQRPSR